MVYVEKLYILSSAVYSYDRLVIPGSSLVLLCLQEWPKYVV